MKHSVIFERFTVFPDFINAVTTTRLGGVSEKPWDTANMQYRHGDTKENVIENRNRVLDAAMFKSNDIFFVNQIHGTDIVCADQKTPEETYNIDADGIYTTEVNKICGVYTADCIPLILSTPSIVGAFHCGWRSIAKGIVKKAVNIYKNNYGVISEEIFAATGAGISLCCFETGMEVVEIFEKLGYSAFVQDVGKKEKMHIDLQGIIQNQLVEAGVVPKNISISDECTYCGNNKYFSYRRNGWPTGQMMSIIAREEK
ncbi:MAG: peptidoglycan editing factor PgeF [Deltaproteobacteria bacterium]|nr:peptidoglycan editing factor PgeF [Deltaproteobacteria bacterium]